MQFMVQLRRRGEAFGASVFAAGAEAEAERVRQMYAEGVVRHAWGRGDVPGAMLLIEAADEAAARAAIESLPFVQGGLAEVTAFTPLVPYRGFGPRG